MNEYLALVLGLVGGLGIGAWRRRSGGDTGRTRLYAAAEALRDFYQQTAQPVDLLDHDNFKEGVELLGGKEFSTTDLLAYYAGDNPVIACMALEALATREPDRDLLEPIVASINDVDAWGRWFALRVLDRRVEHAAARVLAAVDPGWRRSFARQTLVGFLHRRAERGDKLIAGDELRGLPPAQIEWLEELLVEIAPGGELVEQLREQQAGLVDVDFLRSLGRVWTTGTLPQSPSDRQLALRVHDLELRLTQRRPRSLLLVGETGVGKTTTLHALARGLLARGWVVFEAGALELLAGQTHIGQLEERLQRLLRALTHKPRVLWVIPDLHGLLWAGRHAHNETSVLDTLLPHIESGALLIASDSTAGACERLLLAKPRLRAALDVERIAPLGDAETMTVARAWAAAHGSGKEPLMSEATLREAMTLAQQYLGDRAAPGNVLQLLQATRALIEGSASRELTRDDLMQALSRLTGLPTVILDAGEHLHLEELRAFFHQRVLGQPEAVDCLVERVAMIKAGLTDPRRPSGVFLFAGPTGTGKTEIAKTLAEFLFGSPDRMIRLDMSELQQPESLDRILGIGRDDAEHDALVDAIRRQPFSVVLLDEIEKAHPAVWDLFLQLFDDGRLTDRRGATADFRHAIVLMTTNLGAQPWQTTSLGFAADRGGDEARTDKALAAAFRPEFLNRIDRIVLFRPLSRTVMRQILEQELAAVLQRRGLRHRQWAVEWDESALEFLLAEGFSPQLGARPLRRAVERHLLSPLAMTIVDHQVPAGDQFLFVRAGSRGIEVEFVDPDAVYGEAPEAPYADDDLRIERVALDGVGSSGELRFLESVCADLRQTIGSPAWERERGAALAASGEPDFWQSPQRFRVLGRVEYMDRVGAGLKTAGRLLDRLQRSVDGERVAPDLVRRLAEQLYLVRAAADSVGEDRICDAYLQIESSRSPAEYRHETAAFAERLAEMYRGWAQKRRMRLDVLSTGSGERFHAVFGISGFAAWALLAPEDGVHVLEVPDGRRQTLRLRCRVSVAPQPDQPSNGDHALDVALKTIAAHRTARPQIVRRYREEPTPLIRDSVRGWRTGRWDRVLTGDFDLI